MPFNEIIFLALSLVALATVAVLSRGRRRWVPPGLLIVAIALRVIGSTLRYEILFRYYDGLGDAVRYFQEGSDLAKFIRNLQINPLDPWFWFGSSHWWGTPFLIKSSAVVLSVIGPSLRGEFLVYSLASFLGLYAIAAALRRTQPGVDGHLRFAAWIWLWPSLWYWPSSVGKEAILMFAVGLATLGYAGTGTHIRWLSFLAGIGLAFCIRPHVAAVLALAAMAAYWLGSWERFTARRLAESIAAVVLAAVAIVGMREQLGLADADLEGMREFLEYRAEQTLKGGSNIGGVPLGPQGVPLAFINVWMRPFLWEIHNATAAIASFEIVAFWVLVWYRRHAVALGLRRWRHHRLLRFALPTVLVYTVMIGLAFGNLGIIARQRVLVFPFMILIAAAPPDPARYAPARRSRGTSEGTVR